MSQTFSRLTSRRMRRDWMVLIGIIPFALLILGWALAPKFIHYPAYKLPPPLHVWHKFMTMLPHGSLMTNIWVSLERLGIGYILGNAVAIPLGLAVALNRTVAEILRPVLSFFQSIAGIAWVPLSIVWFGFGMGSVLFIIANTIFFSSIYSTVTGVQSIPPVLYRAALSHGASRRDVLLHVVLPGALVQIIVGLRTSMAYGWRALVAAEMIAGTNGLGYMTIEAVQWYQTAVVIVGMAIIGVLWLILDQLVFKSIEKVTVQKWGLIAQ